MDHVQIRLLDAPKLWILNGKVYAYGLLGIILDLKRIFARAYHVSVKILHVADEIAGLCNIYVRCLKLPEKLKHGFGKRVYHNVGGHADIRLTVRDLRFCKNRIGLHEKLIGHYKIHPAVDTGSDIKSRVWLIRRVADDLYGVDRIISQI